MVLLPARLQSITSEASFDLSMETCHYQLDFRLASGECFNVRMEDVSVTAALETVTLGGLVSQSMEIVPLPAGLQI